MTSRLDFHLARADLIALSMPTVSYCEQHDIDFTATIPGCGGPFLAPLRFENHGRFSPDPAGDLGVWLDAFDEDAETPIDSVGWPVGQPSRFCRLSGHAAALGLAHAINPATYVFDAPLALFATPLQWLQASCQGSVVLDLREGARWLIDLPAPKIATVDRQHARKLVHAMDALVGRQRFVVPQQARKAA